MAILDSYPESNKDNYWTGSSAQSFGQSFSTSSATLTSAKFYLAKSGSPTGTIYAKLYGHVGTYGAGGKGKGSPLATSDPVNVSSLTTSFQLITFNFSGANQIAVNGTYVILFDTSGVSGSIYVGSDGSSPTHGGNMVMKTTAGSWYAYTSHDMVFYVYGTPFSSASASPSGVPYTARVVHFVYLLASDDTENTAYTTAWKNNVAECQAFFSAQLGGRTFSAGNPEIDVIYSPRDSAYFSSFPLGYQGAYDITVEAINNTIGFADDDVYVILFGSSVNNYSGGLATSYGQNRLVFLGSGYRDEINLPIVALKDGGQMELTLHELGHCFGLPDRRYAGPAVGTGSIMGWDDGSADYANPTGINLYPKSYFCHDDLTTLNTGINLTWLSTNYNPSEGTSFWTFPPLKSSPSPSEGMSSVSSSTSPSPTPTPSEDIERPANVIDRREYIPPWGSDWAIGMSIVGLGQSFTAETNRTLTSVDFYLKKIGSPTGNAYVKLYNHSGTMGTSSIGTGSALATSNPVDVSTLTSNTGKVNFSFPSGYSLSAGNYVLAVEYIGSSSNYLQIHVDNQWPDHAGNMCGHDIGGTWTSYGYYYDVYFTAYGEESVGSSSLSSSPSLSPSISPSHSPSTSPSTSPSPSRSPSKSPSTSPSLSPSLSPSSSLSLSPSLSPSSSPSISPSSSPSAPTEITLLTNYWNMRLTATLKTNYWNVLQEITSLSTNFWGVVPFIPTLQTNYWNIRYPRPTTWSFRAKTNLPWSG